MGVLLESYSLSPAPACCHSPPQLRRTRTLDIMAFVTHACVTTQAHNIKVKDVHDYTMSLHNRSGCARSCAQIALNSRLTMMQACSPVR